MTTTLGIVISVISAISALSAIMLGWIAFKRTKGKDSKEDIEDRMSYRIKVEQLETRVHDIENKAIVEIKDEIKGLRGDLKEVLDQIIEIYKQGKL